MSKPNVITDAQRKYLAKIVSGSLSVCGEGADRVALRERLFKAGLVSFERISPKDTAIIITPAGRDALNA